MQYRRGAYGKYRNKRFIRFDNPFSRVWYGGNPAEGNSFAVDQRCQVSWWLAPNSVLSREGHFKLFPNHDNQVFQKSQDLRQCLTQLFGTNLTSWRMIVLVLSSSQFKFIYIEASQFSWYQVNESQCT